MQNEIKNVCLFILSRVLNFGTSHIPVEQCREQLVVSCGVSLRLSYSAWNRHSFPAHLNMET